MNLKENSIKVEEVITQYHRLQKKTQNEINDLDREIDLLNSAKNLVRRKARAERDTLLKKGCKQYGLSITGIKTIINAAEKT